MQRLTEEFHHFHWFFKTASEKLFAYDPTNGHFKPLMACGEARHL